MATTVPANNVDVSNCDREQIQFSGAILPHGFLITLREPELIIVQASQNAGAVFNVEARALLGQKLTSVLDPAQVESIREKSQSDLLGRASTRVAIVQLQGKEWNVLAHRYDQVLFLEFEPRSIQSGQSVSDLHSELRGTIAKIQNAKSSQELLDLTVRRIRAFTSFDRVMAYKFLQDGSGWVRSESVIEGQTPYLGLHFPPSDIPAPARRLFMLNWLRHQPDVHYSPVPIIPSTNPLTGAPLDLSCAVLRSVSPIYISYLKNMGTDASMVMTLLKNGKLWGLIACHHHSGPRHVPYEIRAACELLATVVSSLISEKEDCEFSDYRLRLKNTQSVLVEAMSRNERFADVLVDGKPNLLDFVEASGAALVSDDKVYRVGETPTEVQIRSLVEWLSSGTVNEVFVTNSLVSLLSVAEEFQDVASGILAIRFTATMKSYLLWFRPEVIETVSWAGDPHKPVDISEDGKKLLPRNSFALWRQKVRFKSKPWLDLEVQAARELQIAILELMLKRAEQLGVTAIAKFRAVFEQTSVFAGITSLDGTILDANRTCLEVCGYKAEDVLGRQLWTTGWWRGYQETQEKIRVATAQAAQGTPYREVLKYRWADDTERLVNFEMHPIRNDHGQIIFLHPTGIDVTDLKRAEEALLKSHENLAVEVAEKTRDLARSLTKVESEIVVRKNTEAQLQQLSASLLRLQDDERRRIARDLHDSTGQTLASIKMTAASLATLLANGSEASKLVDDLNALSDEAMKDVRTIAHLLHPPLLDEVGFTSAAQWYIEEFAKRSGIKASVDLSGTTRLTKSAELGLFRILQESLTNVLRHSGSTTVDINLGSDDSTAILTVRDYGKGISSEKLMSFNEMGTGMGVGLSGMKQRLRELRGHLKVESDGTGTRVTASLPVGEVQIPNGFSDGGAVEAMPAA